ncbi:hypothetical protein J1605_007266 [Eschrichtius robustus]|uniref:Uncharacterized protein n=1 Tax=Eschrichtius robustus TaxID=9764 RepID=A0AB34H204_ESCRO|nr:hypothetical protein J1605_007266 [Eschrichtius robustus]
MGGAAETLWVVPSLRKKALGSPRLRSDVLWERVYVVGGSAGGTAVLQVSCRGPVSGPCCSASLWVASSPVLLIHRIQTGLLVHAAPAPVKGTPESFAPKVEMTQMPHHPFCSSCRAPLTLVWPLKPLRRVSPLPSSSCDTEIHAGPEARKWNELPCTPGHLHTWTRGRSVVRRPVVWGARHLDTCTPGHGADPHATNVVPCRTETSQSLQTLSPRHMVYVPFPVAIRNVYEGTSKVNLVRIPSTASSPRDTALAAVICSALATVLLALLILCVIYCKRQFMEKKPSWSLRAQDLQYNGSELSCLDRPRLSTAAPHACCQCHRDSAQTCGKFSAWGPLGMRALKPQRTAPTQVSS